MNPTNNIATITDLNNEIAALTQQSKTIEKTALNNWDYLKDNWGVMVQQTILGKAPDRKDGLIFTFFGLHKFKDAFGRVADKLAEKMETKLTNWVEHLFQ